VKIKIVVPHNGRISNHTLQSLDNIKDGNGLEFEFGQHPGSIYVADNRNDQCYGPDGLDAWPDAFLFVDSDMEFTLADIHALAARNVEICCGAYCFKETPMAEFIVAGMWLPDYPGISSRMPGFRSSVTHGCFPVDWSGFGFALVSKAALQKMPFPWFHHPVMPVPPGAGPFPQKAVGEDIGFCLRAREAGIKVYLDADVRIGHINPGARMSEKKETSIPASIDQPVMAISKAMMEMAEQWRQLAAACASLKKENNELKAKLPPPQPVDSAT